MRSLAIPAVGVALVLAGCGSSSSTSTTAATSSAAESPAVATSTTASVAATAEATTTTQGAASGSGSTLAVAANAEGELKYSTTSLTAEKAGHVSIAFTNMSPLGHNLTVATTSGTVIGATPTFQGATHTLTLNLKPGTYKFYCSVPGHRMAGMEGTLTVK